MNERQVMELVFAVLGERPLAAHPMTLTHSGNTIYDVALPGRNVIVRLRGNDTDTLSHTAHNIRALAALGLPVPRMLAADTSLTHYPFRYVILEKIPGRDLLYELPSMTRPQMTRLAERIVAVQTLVGTLPVGTGFGWGHIGGGGAESAWLGVLSGGSEKAVPTGDGKVPEATRLRLHKLQIRFQPYFRSIQPTCFLEDLTTKNVILLNGELQGLIDFDCVCFGDPLWMIGLAAGCIVNDVGTTGLFYIAELCRCWNLTDEQNKAVAYYAANRAMEFWEEAVAVRDNGRSARLLAAMEQWLTAAERR